MKHPHENFKPGERRIPGDWMKTPRSAHHGGAGPDPGHAQRWMTTLPAPLAEVRRHTLQALEEMNAKVAYLYEAEEKVVVRCTLPQRQLRAELKRIDPTSTRIVVVTMNGPNVDRATSGRLVDAIEKKLAEAPSSAG